jgi:hypothetical protein
VSIVWPSPGTGGIVDTNVQSVVADRFPRLEPQVPAGVEPARARRQPRQHPGGGFAGATGYNVFFEPSPPGIDVSPCTGSTLT